MDRPVDVKLLGGGQNWMMICSRIALGLDGYYSELPPGSTVSVTTRDPGRNCFDAPELVASGQYHMAISTPGWVGRLAAHGEKPFRDRLPLCSLALFPHDDRLAFAVKRDTGLQSIGEIKERRYPLRVSTPPRESRHPGVWGAEQVLEEYGFTFEDIESWGGKVLRDRPRNQNLPGTAPVTPQFDALFDEAIMTRRWKTITEQYDINFLPVEEDVLESLVKKGWDRGVISKGRLRGVEKDIPAVDFSGWWFFCRNDMDGELAYLTIKAIDEQKSFINEMFKDPYSGMSGEIVMDKIGRDVPVPLHPGAEVYYREKGYL